MMSHGSNGVSITVDFAFSNGAPLTSCRLLRFSRDTELCSKPLPSKATHYKLDQRLQMQPSQMHRYKA